MGKTEAPTHVRYYVLAFLAAMTFVLYIDRVCISQASTSIQADLGISKSEMGFVFAAFTLAYGLFEVPTGWWADKHGSRRVLMRIVIWWSIFTVLTGAVSGLWMLLVVRFLFGAGEAGALPSAVRIVTHWFPATFRGRAQGIITTSMVLGAAVAPSAAQQLIGLVGWRYTFAIFGCVGVVWALAFYWWFRDDPADHRATNKAERELVVAGNTANDGKPHPSIPWAAVLRSHDMWLLGTLMTCASAVFYVFISWYPQYLQKAREVSEGESGWLASLVLGGGAIGCIVGGILTDYLFRATKSHFRSRCIVGTTAYIIGGTSMVVGLLLDTPLHAALCTMVTVFCIQIQIPAWWASVMAISGRHVGALSGLMNSMGVFGAMASQISIGFVVDWLTRKNYSVRECWDTPLYAIGAIMAVGSVLWCFVRAGEIIGEKKDYRDKAEY